MKQTLLILDGDGADWVSGGLPVARLREAFLRDTLELADRLPHTRPLVVSAGSVRAAAASAIAAGPVALIATDVPHLPIWRLRDAFTHLHARARLVAGPAERGGWYLLGVAAGAHDLLARLPLADPASANLDLPQRDTVTLPAWYRLCTLADLTRLAADLAPMPANIAAHTRALLGDDGLQAREVGS